MPASLSMISAQTRFRVYREEKPISTFSDHALVNAIVTRFLACSMSMHPAEIGSSILVRSLML